eukprot:2261389-Pyramimonas_sp.AAC.1
MAPMCKAFSAPRVSNWGRVGPELEVWEEERGVHAFHLCLQVAEYQIARGRFFALEHPASASSWGLEATRLVLSLPGVERTKSDQCVRGLSVSKEGLSRKPA